jgi:DNA-binding response OmpR family regulator
VGRGNEQQGLDSAFGPVAWALAARGVTLSLMPANSAGRPQVGAGAATIHWQPVDDPEERARAFECGAHEVVGPWMHEGEMIARIMRFAAASDDARLVRGDLIIHLIDRTVERAGQSILLPAREYALLLHLARHSGEAVSREELLRAVWRLDFDPGTNSVEVHMSRLRTRVDRGHRWQMLRTVKGRGYALCPAVAV